VSDATADIPVSPLKVDLSGVSARKVGPRLGLGRRDRQVWTRRLRSAADEVREAAADGLLPHHAWWMEGPPAAEATALPVCVTGEPGAVDAVCLALSDPRLHRHECADEVPTVVVDSAPDRGEPSSEDLRFGPFGPSAQSLRCAVLGRDACMRVDDRIRHARELCASASTDDGAELALGLVSAAWQGAVPTVFCTGPLLELGDWWARVLAATTCKPTGDSGPQVLRGLAPRVARLGDEAALQAAVFGQPTSPAVLLVGARQSPVQRARIQATCAALARRGCPVVVIALHTTDTAGQVGAAWVLLHAALTLAIAIGAQPLTLEAGEDLRRLLDSTGPAPA